jgi:hypothetical protein
MQEKLSLVGKLVIKGTLTDPHNSYSMWKDQGK